MTAGGQAEHGAAAPRIWRLGEVASCLDTAARLAERGLLGVWDSVQVASQTAGRGQLRRRWLSPAGNVYAALRLPLVPPFDGMAAAPAVGALLAAGLRAMGWPVALKWPNDLVLWCADGRPRKVAGILLEERGGLLLAGVGVNVAWAPPPGSLREGAALEAVCLGGWAGGMGRAAPPSAEGLWQRLVNRLHSAYTQTYPWSDGWRAAAEALLLWRDRPVVVRDGARLVRGRLAGLAPSGALRLETDGRVVTCTGGSLVEAGEWNRRLRGQDAAPA